MINRRPKLNVKNNKELETWCKHSNNIRSADKHIYIFLKLWMVIDVCSHQHRTLVWIWLVFDLQKVKLQYKFCNRQYSFNVTIVINKATLHNIELQLIT